jgi:hypothetical protein
MAVWGSVVLHSTGEHGIKAAGREKDADDGVLSAWGLIAATATFLVAGALFATPPAIALLILAGWLR